MLETVLHLSRSNTMLGNMIRQAWPTVFSCCVVGGLCVLCANPVGLLRFHWFLNSATDVKNSGPNTKADMQTMSLFFYLWGSVLACMTPKMGTVRINRETRTTEDDQRHVQPVL